MHAVNIDIHKPTVGVVLITTQWRQRRSISNKDKQDDAPVFMKPS